MIDLKILKRALIVGLTLEIALLGAGYVWPWFRPDLLFGCMMVASVAGLLYARDLARGFRLGALGGLIVGATCGAVAVAVATALNEQPSVYLPYAVMVLALTGTVGGLFGELDARLRALIKKSLN